MANHSSDESQICNCKEQEICDLRYPWTEELKEASTNFIESFCKEITVYLKQQIMDELEPEIAKSLYSSVFGIQEASSYLGCSGRMLRQLCKKGDIRYYKIGNEYRFRQVVLDEWIEDQEKLHNSND